MKKTQHQSDRIADASQFNWVDQFCPLWSKPFLKLSRFDRPVGTWLLLLPCWWGSLLAIWSNKITMNLQEYWILFGCAIGAILMRGAGCTWNDISDQKFDAKVARTELRPIPSGQVSTKKAFVWMLTQLTLAFLILITFNQLAIFLGVLSIIPVIIYPFAKRFTWWPQAFLGICFNWGILLSFAAHCNTIEISTVILYLAGIFWTLFYDTIYAFQDIEDDKLIGVKSTALLFGSSVKRWLLLFTLMTFVSMQIALSLAQKVSFFSELILRTGSVFFCLHLAWQLIQFNMNDKDLCLKLFQSNKAAGLIIIFFGIFAINYA